MGDLTKHFSRSEFSCKCGCGFDDISMELVNILELIRITINSPLKILSGCRCINHNKAVGGVTNSAHVSGHAADVAIIDSKVKFSFLEAAFHYFRRIGIYKKFIHVDIDKTKTQDVVWVEGDHNV